MKRAICCGFAVALVTGCGPTGSRRAEVPAPEDQISVGYQTQSRHNTTAAVTSVSPTDADARVTRLEDLLQARVPGLEVLPLSNGTYTLRIRGRHSLRGGAADDEPLLVIDDVPVPAGALGSALASMAPRDVRRIDVLKDAAAASIYGSRGANGVIIITTKRASLPNP
ncbi:MAG TPA: TonB-dependent receptor plug domain-containing protein [Gemmatimonadales bacterium]|nr:TonB-dependent receptor plug domain-containing protein [Gemmatimonadales bacterium]